jgi:hypothetical protein
MLTSAILPWLTIREHDAIRHCCKPRALQVERSAVAAAPFLDPSFCRELAANISFA